MQHKEALEQLELHLLMYHSLDIYKVSESYTITEENQMVDYNDYSVTSRSDIMRFVKNNGYLYTGVPVYEDVKVKLDDFHICSVSLNIFAKSYNKLLKHIVDNQVILYYADTPEYTYSNGNKTLSVSNAYMKETLFLISLIRQMMENKDYTHINFIKDASRRYKHAYHLIFVPRDKGWRSK